MDIEKLIERMNNHLQSLAAYSDPELAHTLEDAATALSTLQAENEKLRADVVRLNDLLASYQNVLVPELRVELEQVKQERDEAVECVNTVYSYILIKSKTDAVLTIEKWLRGQKED